MPAYSFKERFVPLIKSGDKRQTIRNKRKGQAKAGDNLYLFYGMRTKYCYRILDTICTGAAEIIITANGKVKVGKKWLTQQQREALAKNDGFESFDVMMRWWKQTHKDKWPFIGDIIYW